MMSRKPLHLLLTFLTVGRTRGFPCESRYAPMARLTFSGRGSFLCASTRPKMASGGPCSTPLQKDLKMALCQQSTSETCSSQSSGRYRNQMPRTHQSTQRHFPFSLDLLSLAAPKHVHVVLQKWVGLSAVFAFGEYKVQSC